MPSFPQINQFGDYRLGPFTNPERNSEVFLIDPDEQSIIFPFDLDEDQEFEGIEVFVLHVVVPSVQEAVGRTVVPFDNGMFPNTTIFIVDMDSEYIKVTTIGVLIIASISWLFIYSHLFRVVML